MVLERPINYCMTISSQLIDPLTLNKIVCSLIQCNFQAERVVFWQLAFIFPGGPYARFQVHGTFDRPSI